jgi:chromosome segregation ATPase
VATLGVATAATALMAFQVPAKRAGQNPSTVVPQEADRAVMKKALDEAAVAPRPPSAGNEGEEERAAEDRGRMQARVELLELRSESLRSRIHQGIALVDQLEDSRNEDPHNTSPEQRKRDIKQLERRIDDKRAYIEKWQNDYSQTRIDIARLNYRIARAPRSMYEAERDDSGKSIYELLRRIDRLEAKVDRLSDSIRGGTGR